MDTLVDVNEVSDPGWYFLVVDDEELAHFAGGADLSLPEVLRQRNSFVTENTGIAANKIAKRLPNELLALFELCRDRVHEYRAHRRSTTSFPAPLYPPPSADTLFSSDLYESEQAEFVNLLKKPYEAISTDDCVSLLEDAFVLPDEYIAYFSPALAEHSRNLSNGDLLAKLVAALTRVLPLDQTDVVARGLRRAIENRRLIDTVDVTHTARDWRQPDGSGSGWASTLALLCEMEGASPGNVDLFAFNRTEIAMTVVEHDIGVVDAGWKVNNPLAHPLYSDDAVIGRLEKLCRHSDVSIAEAASSI